MRSIILAGGRGTRLHPLTAHTPKPLVTLFDKPVMELAVELLVEHGITDITATVSHLASQIADYFADGRRHGAIIDYFIEDTPKGTAGALRDIQPSLQETFMVISGDAVTDFNLRKAVDHHHSSGAMATLIVHDVPDPSHFGLVSTDAEGRVIRFVEKPDSSQVFGHTVNTGIYILEPDVVDLIPNHGVFDFSRDLFPILLRTPGALRAYKAGGYWCDIGSLSKYRDAHFDILDNQAQLRIPGEQYTQGAWISPNCHIHPSATICPPVYIGEGVTIEAGATIGGFVVAGNGATIGSGSVVSNTVINAGARISPNCNIHGSILGQDYTMKANASAENLILTMDGNECPIAPVTELRMVEQFSQDIRKAWRDLSQIKSATAPAAAA